MAPETDADEIEDSREPSDDDYDTTYGTLEALREDDALLTEDQRSVLNEAHCIVQEHQRQQVPERDEDLDNATDMIETDRSATDEPTGTLDAEEYREKRDALVREVAREGVEAYNSHDEGLFTKPVGEVYEAIDGAFYLSHPVGIIEHCEQTPRESLQEHAKWVEATEELVRMHAHDLLAEVVQGRIHDLYIGGEVAGIRVETDEETDTMEIVESQ